MGRVVVGFWMFIALLAISHSIDSGLHAIARAHMCTPTATGDGT